MAWIEIDAAGDGAAGGAASGPYTSGDPQDPGNAAAILSASGGWGRQVLSYGFATAVPGYYRAGAGERDGFVEMSAAQKVAVRAALAQIESVGGVRFVEDTDPTDGVGDLVFGTARLPDGIGAWGYLPQASAVGGDVWLSTAFRNNADPAPGSVGFLFRAYWTNGRVLAPPTLAPKRPPAFRARLT